MRRLLVAASLLWWLTVPTFAFPEDVAVVINRHNPAEEMSLSELTKICRREKQVWPDGKMIYLVLRETGSVEKQVALQTVYQMEEQDLKKFWLGKLFREEISSLPQTAASNDGLKRFIQNVPNAIGFLRVAAVDDSVKVLRINGKLPGQDGYPLRLEP